MSHRDRSPVKTLSTRCPLGQDHKNLMSPLHNLTLLQPGIEILVHLAEPGFSQGLFFFSFLSPMELWFLATVAFGLLSWGHFISSNIVGLIAQILFEES